MKTNLTPGRKPGNLKEQILEMLTPYLTPGQTVDWGRLFSEHPDWRKKLSYGLHDRDHQRGSQMLMVLRRQGRLPVPAN